ncbi:MAG: hypothetical protein LBC74_07635, partial [Planctomycetaceae bacterium]|nr:hypothetical protein [Planctomycetaceae bacterium]
MIAVDIGNTQAKFGYFPRTTLQSKFPKPESCIRILHNNKNTINTNNLFDNTAHKLMANWLCVACENDDWYISITASGCAAGSLIDELTLIKPDGNFRILTNNDVPIIANVDFPAKTGIDRLFDAFAAAKFIADEFQNTDSGCTDLSCTSNRRN